MDTKIIEALKYLPHIVTYNNEVVEVSYAFSGLTHYNTDEILGCEYINVLEKLRFAQYTSTSGFIFTKYSEAREVDIIEHKSLINEKLIYVFLEKPGSRLEDKFQVINELADDNNTSVAIYALPDIYVLKANSIYCWYAGKYNISDLTGKKISDTDPNWNSSTLRNSINKVIETGKPYYLSKYEKNISANEMSYWNSTFIPVYEGKVLKYCVEISLNITETVNSKKYMEQQLNFILSQNSELEAIINNMSDGLIILDKSGKLIMHNRSAKEYNKIIKFVDENTCYYDVDGNELLPENIPFKKIMSGEKISQMTICLKNAETKKYYKISGTPIFNKDAEFNIGILCCTDITEQFNYEINLTKQRNNLYKIIYNLDVPIIRLSYPMLDIIEINKKAYENIYIAHSVNDDEFNKDYNKKASVDIVDKLISGDKYKFICQLSETRNTVHVDNVEIEFNGNVNTYNLIYQPLLDTNNDIVEILIIAIDITREARQKKSLQDTLRIQEEFFSFVSHEFKTPLTVINAAVQAIQNLCGDELSEKAHDFIKKIHQNTLRQIRLVNNLLDITKASSSYLMVQKRNCDIISISRAITESVMPYATQKSLNIYFHTNLNKKVIGMDEEKYERVLLNILSNAIKFTPGGKSIYVNIDCFNNNVIINIKDEGTGIPPEKQEIIFERFVQLDSSLTRTSEGTGIGLCLAKLLVNAMDGSLTLESEIGKGSTFTITLPTVQINDDEIKIDRSQTDNRLIKAVAIEFSDIYL